MIQKFQIGNKVTCFNFDEVKDKTGMIGEIINITPSVKDDYGAVVIRYKDGTLMKLLGKDVELITECTLDDEITISRQQFRDLLISNFDIVTLALCKSSLENLEIDLFGKIEENV